MPAVRLVNNLENSNDNIRLNNGDLIILLRDGKDINHLLVSSFKGDNINSYDRVNYCNALQLRSGLAYKSEPLKRKLDKRELRAYLFDEFRTPFKSIYDFEVIKGNAYTINIEIEELNLWSKMKNE